MQNKESYHPKGKTLWDSWFIKEDNIYHAFYLESLPVKNPDERHDTGVSIGHAKSKDLINWEELPTALKPGEGDSWDNLALWTGSIIKKDNKYFLFYTGRNNNNNNKNVQKIGLAVSDDLINFKRYQDRPILEIDSKYYVTDFNQNSTGKIGIWRDPYIFFDEKNKKYCMTISARDKKFGEAYNGCVALASSHDLINWEIHKPILSNGYFDEIETTQVVIQNNIYYLLFSAHEKRDAETQEVIQKNGLYCYYSDKIDGQYKPVNNDGLIVDYNNGIYDLRLIHQSDNNYYGIGWLNESGSSKFLGRISHPIKIRIDGSNFNFI